MEVNLYPSRPQFSRAKKYLFNIENLVLRASPRSRLAGVRMQWPCRYRCEISWSPGVFEYWSVGKNESRNLMRIGLFITPLLQHSNTPADWRKEERVGSPLRGQSKAGPAAP
jgi:hypothetical protein